MLQNYRQVSNLTQLSKVTEKIVASRLTENLPDQRLYNTHQSAYRNDHPAETALLRMVNDARAALDRWKGTVLFLIDLSAAFDTIDHRLLLESLRLRFGLDGLVLAWLKSYLSSKTQRVVISDASSGPLSPDTGIPQGSVLGPVLFSLYVQPIGDIVPCHGLQCHYFADDLQLRLTFDLNTDSLSASLGQTELCLAEIKN